MNERLAFTLQDDSHTIYLAFNADAVQAVPGEREEASQSTDAGLLGYVAVHSLPYLFLPGPEGFISELFSHPEGRSRGIGARLLGTAKAEARLMSAAESMQANIVIVLARLLHPLIPATRS